MKELQLLPIIKFVDIPENLQKLLLKNTSLYYQSQLIWIDSWNSEEYNDYEDLEYQNCIKSFAEWVLYLYGDMVKQYECFYIIL